MPTAQVRMRAHILLLLLLLCTQLQATSLDHLILSQGQGLTLKLKQQQFQGVEQVTYGDAGTKRKLKVVKGPYGGANMNRDPHAPKNNNAPSQLSCSFCIGIGFGFCMLLLFNF